MAGNTAPGGTTGLRAQTTHTLERSPRITLSDPGDSPALPALDDDPRRSDLIRPSVRSLNRRARGLSNSPAISSGRSSVHGRVTSLDRKAASAWKEKVDDPWDCCILTLDGGGIRGFSSALILERLMEEIYEVEKDLEDADPTGESLPSGPEQLLPCHYFDFMFGTSTGGLIAVMLARLRMTMSQCIEQYRIVGNKLFGHRKNIIPFMTKYRSKPLEVAVKKLVDDQKLGQWHPWDPEVTTGKFGEEPLPLTDEEPHGLRRNDSFPLLDDQPSPAPIFDVKEPRVCHSCCLTAIHNHEVQEAHLLRSYPHWYLSNFNSWLTIYNSGADRLRIWQVCRATSAAPFYFDMLEAEVNNQLRGHKDGGIRDNNPSDAAYNEFLSMYHPRSIAPNETPAPALLLSIGTGLTKDNPDGFMTTLPFPLGYFSWIRRIAENFSVIPNLLVKFTDSEGRHIKMKERAHGENTWYKRLNVSSGMDNMPLDSWSSGEYHGNKVPGGATLTKMEDATLDYLEREFEPCDSFDAPKVKLRHAAEKLVRIRRARQKLGGERWRYFIGEGLEERMQGQ